MGSAEAKLDDRYKQATTGGSHPGATVALQKQPLRSASQSRLSEAAICWWSRAHSVGAGCLTVWQPCLTRLSPSSTDNETDTMPKGASS